MKFAIWVFFSLLLVSCAMEWSGPVDASQDMQDTQDTPADSDAGDASPPDGEPDGDAPGEEDCVPLPAGELCNGEDDDCDGGVDEDFDCVKGEEMDCTTECGTDGTIVCTDACMFPEPLVCTPPAETCNGLDDDCDDACDNGFGCCGGESESAVCDVCGLETRTCTESCAWGAWSECVGGGECTPGDEETNPCDVCGRETRTCTGTCTWGAWSECEGQIESCRNGSEICDDQAFRVPSPYVPLVMICVNGNGGVIYVSSNTGPECEDGV
ncbi:MAG: hypothetical protein ABIJ56_00445, partial [Pseudomonadota bacterium]